tara:strand:+ start:27 stop:254 length:228 start_codon:yes stop_codon:yes gene_type:complete
MISAFFTGVVVAIPTSLVMMKLLNSSLFINNSELRDMNQKISVVINQIDEFREERREEREKFLNVSDDTKQVLSD